MKQLGPGQVLESDCGSGPALDSSQELDQSYGWLSGLGLDYRVALSPVSTNRPLLHGSDLYDPICLKAQDPGLEKGLRLGLPSTFVMTTDCISPISSSPNAGQEGNAFHNGKEDELKEVAVQEDGRDHMNRYGDNPYVQSTPIPFSFFGCPLLSGGFSGPVGSFADKDLEPLRVVATDGKEWGLECSGATIDVGEELSEVGQRKIEEHYESSETWTHESWESSCLAKFSDFLGFPTGGFEKEILNLLRNLVASQKLGKEKGILTVSKSERELRRLRSTINYNGNKTNKGGGRDRRNLLLKLK